MSQAGKDVVLITGGNGLIGRALARRLSENFDVVALDLKDSPQRPASTSFLPMDVSSEGSVKAALRKVQERYGERIASVIHLAAYYSFSGAKSPKYDEITVRGTERLLRGLQGMRVEQFVFSSTLLVHAPCEVGQKISEAHPLDPKWPYPRSKVDAEAVIKETHGGIPYVILRIAGVYDDQCHSIPIAHQIERIRERHLTGHFYPGDLGKGQPFLHLDDLVEAFRLAVEKRRTLPDELTLLIGEPETMSYGELQDELGRLIHGSEWLTQRIPKPVAKMGAWAQDRLPLGEEPFIKPWMVDLADDHQAIDISRAREALAWEPQHRLRESLPRMIESMQRDEDGFYRENKLSEPIAAAVWARKVLPGVVGVLSLALVGFFAFRKRRVA